MIIAIITTILYFHLFMVFLSVYELYAHVDGVSLCTCGDHKSTSGASVLLQSISRQDLSLNLEPMDFLDWLTRDPPASSLPAQCSAYRHVPPYTYICARVLMHV